MATSLPGLAMSGAMLLPLLLLLLASSSASAANFTCTAPATCQSAIGYTTRNATTYAELHSRFNTSTLGELLRVNGLPPTATPPNATIPAAATITIPFRCLCAGNGIGRSDDRPIYVVQPQDGLDAIARGVFDGFVTYQEIATASNIPDPNKILVGQELWIPLPCSCDPVDGYNVTHFAYKVRAVDTTSAIAAKFGVYQATLLKINGMTDPKSLAQGQILDVPIPGNHAAVPASVPSVAPPSLMAQSKNRGSQTIGITVYGIALPATGAVIIVASLCFCIRRKRRLARKPSIPVSISQDIQNIDTLILDLSTLQTATHNFDECNKLGEGGFGVVYKGTLRNGQTIAVKRLSHCSQQGVGELKNELVLVGKLQHKNLVKLVGVCLENSEKLLVYEYMPNKSLDTILFDPDKSKELDWGKRLRIITEIARGLQYLHEESRLKIIHRDLKAQNILLDSNLTPKISDFGLAKLFGGDQSHIVTNRVAGTYGYMAPEYAMCGQYSVKSDVFSFGVIVLEVLTGRRSIGSYNYEQSVSLLGLIWQHWTAGTILELLDPSLIRSSSSQQCSDGRDQMRTCMHIGLLCVQENPADRPMLSSVAVMLRSSTPPLQPPSRPAFCLHWAGEAFINAAGAGSSGGELASANHVSVTELQAR